MKIDVVGLSMSVHLPSGKTHVVVLNVYTTCWVERLTLRDVLNVYTTCWTAKLTLRDLLNVYTTCWMVRLTL